jgi:hypothetical protein
MHAGEPLVPDPSPSEVETAIAKLKKYKTPGSDQIPAELIQAGGETLQSEIHKLINSIWSKEELPDQWKESITVPIYKKGDKTECSNYRGISLLSTASVVYWSEFLAIDPKVLGSIPGASRFSERQRVWNVVHSAS